MKLRYAIFVLSLFLVNNVLAQTNKTYHKTIPFLDRDSQSNIVVIENGVHPHPGSLKYTNLISNTNLFTLAEQELIGEIYVKYKNVTTNSGPPGTVLVGLYKTNYIVKAISRTVEIENWIANFQYTNFDAHEEIRFSGGMFARFRNKSNDGYNVSFNDTGGETELAFLEIKKDHINGLFARFEDAHAQGMNWDYRLANFDGSHLEEYRHYTNRMVLGKFLCGIHAMEFNFRSRLQRAL
jgi:hypothetical protein